MVSEASVVNHLEFIENKHSELINEFQALLSDLVGTSKDNSKKKVKELYLTVKNFQGMMSEKDHPDWLGELHSALANNVGLVDPKFGELINELALISEQIINHEWILDHDSEDGFDFDAIYEKYRSESRLSELFREIIKILEKIKSSGQIKDLEMENALCALIATLNQNKDGSYLSINTTWEFVINLLRNYLWAELSRIPVLGPVLEALEKTIRETHAEITKLHSDVQNRIEDEVYVGVKAFKEKPDFGLVSYDRKGIALPSVKGPSIIEEA
ncbi:MAG: hypothetical protein K6L74_06515 [Neptuniibacter sp.]